MCRLLQYHNITNAPEAQGNSQYLAKESYRIPHSSTEIPKEDKGRFRKSYKTLLTVPFNFDTISVNTIYRSFLLLPRYIKSKVHEKEVMYMRLAVVIGIVLVACILYYRPFGSLWFVKNKCSATAPGHYVYCEGYYTAQMPGNGKINLVPVYEYTVDNKLYMTIVEGMEQSYDVFPLEVEVKYNPNDSEMCFINGKRGKIVTKK